MTILEYLASPRNADDYGFVSYICDKESLAGRVSNILAKIKFFISEGIINPKETQVALSNSETESGYQFDEILFQDKDGNYLGGLALTRTPYLLDSDDNKMSEAPTWGLLKKKMKEDFELRFKLIDLYK